MKRNCMATLLSILCASVLCFSAAGCGGRPGRTSLSLDDGWQVRADPAGEGERLGWNEGFQTDSEQRRCLRTQTERTRSGTATPSQATSPSPKKTA